MDFDGGRIKNVCVSNLANWVGAITVCQDKEHKKNGFGKENVECSLRSCGASKCPVGSWM